MEANPFGHPADPYAIWEPPTEAEVCEKAPITVAVRRRD